MGCQKPCQFITGRIENIAGRMFPELQQPCEKSTGVMDGRRMNTFGCVFRPMCNRKKFRPCYCNRYVVTTVGAYCCECAVIIAIRKENGSHRRFFCFTHDTVSTSFGGLIYEDYLHLSYVRVVYHCVRLLLCMP